MSNFEYLRQIWTFYCSLKAVIFNVYMNPSVSSRPSKWLILLSILCIYSQHMYEWTLNCTAQVNVSVFTGIFMNLFDGMAHWTRKLCSSSLYIKMVARNWRENNVKKKNQLVLLWVLWFKIIARHTTKERRRDIFYITSLKFALSRRNGFLCVLFLSFTFIFHF